MLSAGLKVKRVKLKPRVGDICLYKFDNGNKSKCLVIIQEPRRPMNRNISTIKFIKVFFDDSSNEYFSYLCETGYTMEVSNKYLFVMGR